MSTDRFLIQLRWPDATRTWEWVPFLASRLILTHPDHRVFVALRTADLGDMGERIYRAEEILGVDEVRTITLDDYVKWRAAKNAENESYRQRQYLDHLRRPWTPGGIA